MEIKKFKSQLVPISKNYTYFEKILAELEKVRYTENSNNFYKETAYYKSVDGKDSYYYLFSRLKSNDFNKGSGYLTHGFDFYRGSFHGQMIRGLINSCNLHYRDIILDPFCGCGTTLIEAKLLGFASIGIDINPIACLNSKIKSELLDFSLNKLFRDNDQYFNLSYYSKYSPLNMDYNAFLNLNVKDLFYFFIYTLAISMENRLSINKLTGFKKLYNKFQYILNKFETLKSQININFGKSKVIFNDNLLQLRKMKTNSIDAIITSPPYLDLIDYIQEDNLKISLFFDNKQIDSLKNSSIGKKYKNELQTFKNYWYKMNLVLKEFHRILKHDKKCILIIGNYYNMKNKFKDLIHENNFLINKILKRKVENIKKKDNVEFVIFLEKK